MMMKNKKSHDYCNVHSILDFHLVYALKAYDHAITCSFLFSSIKAVLTEYLAAFLCLHLDILVMIMTDKKF